MATRRAKLLRDARRNADALLRGPPVREAFANEMADLVQAQHRAIHANRIRDEDDAACERELPGLVVGSRAVDGISKHHAAPGHVIPLRNPAFEPGLRNACPSVMRRADRPLHLTCEAHEIAAGFFQQHVRARNPDADPPVHDRVECFQRIPQVALAATEVVCFVRNRSCRCGQHDDQN